MSEDILHNFKSISRALFSNIGFRFVSSLQLESLHEFSQQNQRDIEFLRNIDSDSLVNILQWLPKSKSQLRQDLFVLSRNDFKKNGFFIEFGATDGIALSNTYLLEHEFQWKGILAEPATIWLAALTQNRPNSAIENRCVWKESDLTLEFSEARRPELSSIASFASGDSHAIKRRNSRKYEVSTISINHLLRKHYAPKTIDYLSIDTEGSEFEILDSLDFDEYRIQTITVEHNFTGQRSRIFDLLIKKGYRRIYENISLWDDWYVLD